MQWKPCPESPEGMVLMLDSTPFRQMHRGWRLFQARNLCGCPGLLAREGMELRAVLPDGVGTMRAVTTNGRDLPDAG